MIARVVELEGAVADLTNASGLSEDDARLVKMLGDRAFVSHPADKGNASWLTREQLVERIRALEPITEPGAIFANVVVADEVNRAYSLNTSIVRSFHRMILASVKS